MLKPLPQRDSTAFAEKEAQQGNDHACHWELRDNQEGVNDITNEYNNFYGFSENPFAIAPNPRFFFLAENNRESWASLKYGINERKGFILISGPRGIGKTSLIQYLLNNLDKKIKGVIIDQPGIGIGKILIQIFIRLGLPQRFQDKISLIQQLNAYLIQRLASDENLAIFIDEAQHLSKETMEELRLLSNLETSTSKLLQIILVGQPDIEAKLDSRGLRQLKQRIVLKSRIGHLTEEEAKWYIDYRLRLAGSSSSKVFTPEAVSLIYRYSKGVPLNINIQCSKAFGIGYRFSKKRIDSSIVKKINSSVSRKMIHSVPVLVCLAVLIILLGGKYTKNIATLFLPDKPSVASAPPKPEKPKKTFVKVKEGTTLSSLSKLYYNQTNITLIDRILMANPEITNPHLINTNQTIQIPDITEDSLIIESPRSTPVCCAINN